MPYIKLTLWCWH